jgi:hypothetical protein
VILRFNREGREGRKGTLLILRRTFASLAPFAVTAPEFDARNAATENRLDLVRSKTPLSQEAHLFCAIRVVTGKPATETFAALTVCRFSPGNGQVRQRSLSQAGADAPLIQLGSNTQRSITAFEATAGVGFGETLIAQQACIDQSGDNGFDNGIGEVSHQEFMAQFKLAVFAASQEP